MKTERHSVVVASASLVVERGARDSVQRLDISAGDVEHKAVRCCPTGVAACGFAGVEMGTVIEDRRQNVDVLCVSAGACAMQPERLQAGLDRLSAAATPVVITK